MTQTRPRPAAPFSMRFSRDERVSLEEAAGVLPLAAYIRFCLFEYPTPKRYTKQSIEDRAALAEVLAALGRSRLSSNLNQIARALHQGKLDVSPETEQALLKACSDIAAMRDQLHLALGLKESQREDRA